MKTNKKIETDYEKTINFLKSLKLTDEQIKDSTHRYYFEKDSYGTEIDIELIFDAQGKLLKRETGGK